MDEFETKQKRVSLSMGFDRISQLPQQIIHHILFFMPTKDAARTSALSKSWLQAWNSLPRFDLKHSDVTHYDPFNLSNGEEVDIDHEEMFSKNHVQTLDLDIRSKDNVKAYALPQTTFGVGSLAVLSLKGEKCKLDKNYFSYDMKSICLRELSLDEVDVDSLTIKKILKCCPLLEALTITMCTKVKRVELVNVPKLKKANVQGVNKLRIEAPNLEKLNCSGDLAPILNPNSIACNNISFTSEELSKDQLPPLSSLENLVLERVPPMQDYTALVDGLLWICHPKLLSAYPDYSGVQFTNFLCQTLVNREEEPKCCGDSHMKCWRHYLISGAPTPQIPLKSSILLEWSL
uniref:F-box domain-containing protein n=1 Tax=Fagus sylvatica TaxID=28930 RepID=A0A2N9IJ03_FAGSY